MKYKLGYKLFCMTKAILKMQGFELFDDGEIWNNITGKKVAELTDSKIEDGKVDIYIKTMKSIDFIPINITLDNDE